MSRIEKTVPGNLYTDVKRSLNVLIVDDDDVCLLIQRRVAEASGFFNTIRSAKSGKTALEILGQAEKGIGPFPDIIFLDLNMPVMTGFEFLKAFAKLNLKNRDRISIVILSSSTATKDKAHATSMGAAHYLIKPLELRELKFVVSSIHNMDYSVGAGLVPVTLGVRRVV